jgi:hypothetical protein
VLNDTQEIRPTPTPPDKRSPLYLLTGLIIGLLLGLIYAWVINPVIYENSAPASLDEGDKDIYRKTIAQVYAVTGNLERAASRLALLEDPDPILALGSQAQLALAAGNDSDARALALLASVLQSSSLYQPPTLENTDPPATTTEPQTPLVPTYTLPIPTSTP